jgi:hypothetical protein
MIRYHYHENLTSADVENTTVYQMKVVFTELYLKHADEVKTNFHYYATPNGAILVDFMELMIYHSLDVELIEITKV